MRQQTTQELSIKVCVCHPMLNHVELETVGKPLMAFVKGHLYLEHPRQICELSKILSRKHVQKM